MKNKVIFLLILFLVYSVFSAKLCLKLVERERGYANHVQTEIQKWLDENSDLKIMSVQVQRSDDKYSWYYIYTILYECSNTNHTFVL